MQKTDVDQRNVYKSVTLVHGLTPKILRVRREEKVLIYVFLTYSGELYMLFEQASFEGRPFAQKSLFWKIFHLLQSFRGLQTALMNCAAIETETETETAPNEFQFQFRLFWAPRSLYLSHLTGFLKSEPVAFGSEHVFPISNVCRLRRTGEKDFSARGCLELV